MSGISLITLAVSIGFPTVSYGTDCAAPYTGGNTGCSNSGSITSLTNSGGTITVDGNSTSGSTISGNYIGIINQSSGSFGTITNGITGTIRASGSTSSALGFGIKNNGAITTLTNSGMISADLGFGNDFGIANFGVRIDTLTNTNTGTIVGSDYGIFNTEGGSRTPPDPGSINTLSNIGSISGSVGIFNYGSTIDNLTNAGTINGSRVGIYNTNGAYNPGTIVSLSNSGTISSARTAIFNSGTISTLSNIEANGINGTISGGSYGISNNGTIGTLSNTGIIRGDGFTGLSNSGTIGSLSNSGTIVSAYSQGFNNSGTITTLTNTGAISSLNNTGIITTLNNKQGASGALSYGGVLPLNYNIIISSTNNYGQLNFSPNPNLQSGMMAFGIYSGSILQSGTYNSVLQGFGNNLSNYLSSGETGSITISGSTYSWSFLEQGSTGIWDLILAGGGSSNTDITGVVLASTLTGDPTFNGGTLVMNQNDQSYANNFTVSSSATNTIDQDGNTSTFTGVFSNAAGQSGNLVISNSGNGGKVIFTGANTYTGTTTVTGGADVAVNGSMLSSFVVNSGGLLQGNGSFGGGSINSGGILAPGNSIGTITSNGALTFALGSTYQVEVNAAGQSDKIAVNGAATLQGGTVAVSGSLPSTPLALLNTKYTILTATNGVSGQFSNVSGLPSYSFLTGGLSYGTNEVTLGYTFATPFSTVAKNINQRNVGNSLTIAALGPINSLGAPILNALFYGNYQNAQSVMDTVGGSGLAGVQSTAMQVGEMASSSVSDQIAFWRSGETMDATGRTSQEGNNPRNFLAYAATNTKAPAKGLVSVKGPPGDLAAAVAPRTFRAWGSMFGGGASYLSDAGRGAAASNIGYYGGLIGVDYQIQPNILVGVAVGGSSSNFNVGSLSTNGNLTGFHAGVYGAYTMGNSYIALNETFSAYNNQTSRKAGGYAYLPYEQLSAQFGSTEFRTRGELGHGVLMGGLKATPFVAAEIAAYQSNAFSEQSSIYASTFALKNNGQGVNSLPTFAGLRLSNAVTLSNGWRLAPVGSVAYVHEFFPQRQFNNILMSMPGADFNVAGPRSTYNLVHTKVGAQLNLNEKLALFTDFQGEFSPVSQSYGGKGGVKYVW